MMNGRYGSYLAWHGPPGVTLTRSGSRIILCLFTLSLLISACSRKYAFRETVRVKRETQTMVNHCAHKETEPIVSVPSLPAPIGEEGIPSAPHRNDPSVVAPDQSREVIKSRHVLSKPMKTYPMRHAEHRLMRNPPEADGLLHDFFQRLLRDLLWSAVFLSFGLLLLFPSVREALDIDVSQPVAMLLILLVMLVWALMLLALWAITYYFFRGIT